MSNSADSQSQHRHPARRLRTSMLLGGILTAGMSLLLATSLMFQAFTQVASGPPIVKASDKWITLGGDASTSQVQTALSQYGVIQRTEPKQTKPGHNDPGIEAPSAGARGIPSHAQSSSPPVRRSVASACPDVTKREASDRHISACPGKRERAATVRVARDQGQWPRPSACT